MRLVMVRSRNGDFANAARDRPAGAAGLALLSAATDSAAESSTRPLTGPLNDPHAGRCSGRTERWYENYRVLVLQRVRVRTHRALGRRRNPTG
jgi:hypothetical protein